MPDNNGGFTSDTECVDSSRGNAETYLTVDVPTFIKDRLGTATDAKSWAVVGFSEGGNCALMLALRHPDLFATFGDYSGLPGPRVGTNMEVTTEVADLFGGSRAAFEAHEPADLLQNKRYPGMAGWFEVANDDGGPLAAAQHLAGLSRKAGIEACVVVLPTGGHAFPVWQQAFKDSLPWLAARLGLVPVSPEQTRHCRSA
jgi:S-formylglutathione hydrolase FrmB